VTLAYLDASALVKLVVAEPESDALRVFLEAWPDRLSSALSAAEVPRALRRARFGVAERQRAQRLLARLALIDVDRRILVAAAALEPRELRTLDAIHLATALVVREDLGAIVTYDRRLAKAADRMDLDVYAPA
jgi:predicted nucleic acid-binding protein